MTTINLAWGLHVSPGFVRGVIDLCKDYNWQPSQASDLMSCMAFESGETFSPSVKNGAGSGAVGLIQFMPSTAIQQLGTTVENLDLLSAESQLTYVKRYFGPYARRIHTLSDMYMAILWPRAVGAPDTEVLFTRGGATYRQNGPLDANSDGRITKAEAAAHVQAKLVKGLRPEHCLIGVEF